MHFVFDIERSQLLAFTHLCAHALHTKYNYRATEMLCAACTHIATVQLNLFFSLLHSIMCRMISFDCLFDCVQFVQRHLVFVHCIFFVRLWLIENNMKLTSWIKNALPTAHFARRMEFHTLATDWMTAWTEGQDQMTTGIWKVIFLRWLAFYVLWHLLHTRSIISIVNNDRVWRQDIRWRRFAAELLQQLKKWLRYWHPTFCLIFVPEPKPFRRSTNQS